MIAAGRAAAAHVRAFREGAPAASVPHKKAAVSAGARPPRRAGAAARRARVRAARVARAGLRAIVSTATDPSTSSGRRRRCLEHLAELAPELLVAQALDGPAVADGNFGGMTPQREGCRLPGTPLTCSFVRRGDRI